MRRINGIFVALFIIGFFSFLLIACMSDSDYLSAGQAFGYGVISTLLMIIGVGGYIIANDDDSNKPAAL